MYIDKLNDIVDKYNNTSHKTIKIKPIDVKSSIYTEYYFENNDKDPKFKVGDNLRISKCKNIFAKGFKPNWSEEVFVMKKIKNAVPWKCVISDFNSEEIVVIFYEKEWQKTNQIEFRIENSKWKLNVIKYMLNGEVVIIHLITGSIKIHSIDILCKMSQYFP